MRHGNVTGEAVRFLEPAAEVSKGHSRAIARWTEGLNGPRKGLKEKATKTCDSRAESGRRIS